MPGLSAWGRAQKAPPLRAFANVPPGTVRMANGFPHPELFTLRRLTLEDVDGHTIVLDGQSLSEAQQYAPSAGHEPMRAWAQAWVEGTLHPASHVRTTMTCGNFDALARTLDAMLDPGDALLVEEHSFPHSMNILAPWASARGVRMVEARGRLDAPTLRRACQESRPRVVLTIPTGQNPTTADTSTEEMAAIYDVAREYDLWLVEDDPYYLTHFGTPRARPSYLACDTDGRVVRLDTCSKWLSPGWRLGWLTGHPDVVAKIAPLLAFPSTVSQVLVHRWLDAWGAQGLEAHLARLRVRYADKCARMHRLLQRHVGPDLAEWTPPGSGMFFWLRIVGGPWAGGIDTDAFARASVNHGVTAVPGSLFRVDHGRSAGLRLTFVAVSDEEMEVGVRRLAALLRAHPP